MLAKEQLVMRVLSKACLLAINRQVGTARISHVFIVVTIGEMSVGEIQCSQRRTFYPQIKMIGLAETLADASQEPEQFRLHVVKNFHCEGFMFHS